jgi:hypothetical protein
MKYINRFLMTLVIALAVTVIPALSQTAFTEKKLPEGGKVVYVDLAVPSTSTVYSTPFTLDGFLENTSSYPLSVSYSVDTSNVASGTDIDSVALTLQGTNNPSFALATFTVVDTVSLTLGTTAYTNATMDLNSKKYAWYRWAAVGKGANTGAAVKLNLYGYRKDH